MGNIRRGVGVLNSKSRIFLYHLSDELPPLFRSFVDSLQEEDPLAPVTVVVPSWYAGFSLRHELGRSGLANVRFITSYRLSDLLGAPSRDRQKRRPLTPIIEGASIRAVLEKASGRLAPVSSHPSTHRSLMQTFRQLRRASDAAGDRLGRRGSLTGEVVDLYRRFQARTCEFYHDEELAEAAAEAVRNDPSPELENLGFTVFFQARDLTSGERKLIEALAAAGRCAVFLGLTGEQETDAPVKELAGELSAWLGEPQFGHPEQSSGDTRLVVAPDPHQEIRWVIRHMMRQAKSGTPFHRMAVLYRKGEPYGTLIRGELEAAGIPVAGQNPSPLADTAVGRTLTELTELTDGEFKRDSVMSWLTSCPVRPPHGNAGSFNPSRWDAVSKEAGIVRGLDQWRQRLKSFSDRQDRSAKDLEEQGEISEARAKAKRSEAAAARDLMMFVEHLAKELTPPPNGSPWEDFCCWADNLLASYLVREADIPEPEQQSLHKIREVLSDLKAVESITPGATLDDFRQALRQALQQPLGHRGRTGQGVFVAPIASAIAMRFDRVYLVGMIEGAVPPAIRDDPLIPDSERRAAGGAAAGLPLRQEQKVKERYEFLAALASAPFRVLSYPVAEPAGQRANYASRWFVEQASILERSPVHASGLASLGDRTWLTLIPSAERALGTVEETSPADVHDYGLERIWRWKNAGHAVRNHPLANADTLAKSLTMRRQRYGAGLTRWDGYVSDAGARESLSKRLSRSGVSATSLERWARCPFSYFLGNVLGIGSVERPEEVYSIAPLDKGSLVHEILERFIREARDGGTLPRPDESWSDAQRDTLRSIAEELFEDAEARGVTGKALLWQIEKESILYDLDNFLEQDTEIRKRFRTSPARVEARFGLDGDSWPEAVFTLDDGTAIKFRGMIDRVDRDTSGKRVLVMDYKTGGASPYKNLGQDPIDRGRRLQLSIYSLAARLGMEKDAEVEAVYWFVAGGGGPSLVPAEPVNIDEERTRKRFAQGVSTIVSGIGKGLFPANPGKWTHRGLENCSFCDFDSLCPSRRDVLWNRKKGQDLLADYVELSEEV